MWIGTQTETVEVDDDALNLYSCSDRADESVATVSGTAEKMPCPREATGLEWGLETTCGLGHCRTSCLVA